MKLRSSQRAARWAATLLFAFSLFQFYRCGDDARLEEPGVVARFAGQVLDENRQPVAGALVEAGDARAYTDQRGVFRLDPTLVPRRSAVLRVGKRGYFQFVRAYAVEPDAFRTVTIQLLERTLAGTVVPTQGGTVQVGPATVTFPANAFENGASNSLVRVYARYLDPTDPQLALHMPGDLRGLTASGEEHVLVTYGMIGVELEGMDGRPVQLAPGVQAGLTIPVVA